MGWTSPATWTVGELVLASKLNTHVRDNLNSTVHLIKYKSADESVTSSTAVQDDNDLFFALATNEIWYVRFIVYVIDNSSSTADIRMTFTWPAGTTAALSYTANDTAAAAKFKTFVTSGTEFTNDASLTGDTFDIHGIVTAGGTAGNLQFRWAQAVSNASSVVVKKGSCIVGMKLA